MKKIVISALILGTIILSFTASPKVVELAPSSEYTSDSNLG
ncbi:hypothetical protein MACH08_40520 [Oceanobacillus kimchii]|uniref:Phr family secreted Rap phosphatase inhibitor n=1 Tax=Oceanobacillus kimchii TaxID=746691 RepID=A0ABQ5TN79_9BACI|nr:hypothetical protein MACH08_40520 [Oceanobacillus kimchii]